MEVPGKGKCRAGDPPANGQAAANIRYAANNLITRGRRSQPVGRMDEFRHSCVQSFPVVGPGRGKAAASSSRIKIQS